MKKIKLICFILNYLFSFGNHIVVAARLKHEGIVGGEFAEPGDFKYMVSVQADYVHNCGGGIISDRFVITVAHCFLDHNNNFMNNAFSVVAGINDLLAESDTRVRVDIEKISVPREYRYIYVGPHIYYRETADIAVAKLKHGLGLGRNAGLSRLYFPTYIPGTTIFPTYEYLRAMVTGFGHEAVELVMEENQIPVEVPVLMTYRLKYAEVFVHPNSICSTIYDTKPFYESHMCAQVNQRNDYENEGICKGDSGGPLVYDGNIIIGIASTSLMGCSERDYPATYTRISSFINFIQNAMQDRDAPDTISHTYIV